MQQQQQQQQLLQPHVWPPLQQHQPVMLHAPLVGRMPAAHTGGPPYALRTPPPPAAGFSFSVQDLLSAPRPPAPSPPRVMFTAPPLAPRGSYRDVRARRRSPPSLARSRGACAQAPRRN